MATAISSAFQSDKTEDEQSYQPSRKAPPIPTIAYGATIAQRTPEQGERPIYQANTTSIREQQGPQQYSPRQYSPQQQQQDYHQQQQQQQYSQYQQAQVPSTAPPQQSQKHVSPQYHYYPQPRQQPPFTAQSTNSRPSTQHTAVSQPQTSSSSYRGRQDIDNNLDQATPISPTTANSNYSNSNTAAGTVAGSSQTKKRSNSFSFLRRNSATQSAPRTAQAPTATNPTNTHQSQSSDVSINTPSIFRARSRDGKSERNMLRKQSKLKQQQEELERQRRAAELAQRPAPRLPETERLPYIETFGGDTNSNIPGGAVAAANFSRPSTNNNVTTSMPSRAGATSPPPSSSAGAANGDYYEPSGERSSSMTNRGRYSYASSTAQIGGNVNSPRRVRRRKDPTPFNVLVIGTKNSGKTSFISFLRNSLSLRADKQDASVNAQPASRSTFVSQYLETEMDGERVGVTLWDSVGLEKNIVDLQLREMTAFIESKFEDTFSEEQKVVRSPGFRDTHIHCVFLVLDPIRLDSNILTAAAAGRGMDGLDQDVDLQVLQTLWGKTTVIPVIAKADTLTTSHMNFLKRSVWQSVKTAKLNPLDALELDDDDEDFGQDEDDEDDDSGKDYDEVKPKRPSHNRQSSIGATINDEDPYIPMSILSPDPYSMPPYTKYAPKSQSEIGRRYAWGFASPFDPQHCDFIRLRDTIFSEWRADLRELSRVKWYEQWRTSRLRHAPNPKRAGVALSGSQGLPLRAPATNGRGYQGPAPNVPRSVQANTQQPMQRQAPVGMAVTTPSGVADPHY